MKIIFEQSKGNRIKKQFCRLDCVNYSGESYSYSEKYKKFMSYDEIEHGVTITNSCKCKTLKQTLRILKRSNLPKGVRFVLWNKWENYDIDIIS